MAAIYQQFLALSDRRIFVYIRTKNFLLVSLLFFVCSNLLFYLISFGIKKDSLNIDSDPIDFKAYSHINPSIAFVYNSSACASNAYLQNVTKTLTNFASQELNRTVLNYSFGNISEFNKWVYDTKNTSENISSFNLLMGLCFDGEGSCDDDVDITVLYNSSAHVSVQNSYVNLFRSLWKEAGLGSYTVKSIGMDASTVNIIIGTFLPIFLFFSQFYFVSSLIRTTSNDLEGGVRNYLIASGMNVFIYWCSIFFVDFIFFLSFYLLNFLVHYFVGVELFKNNPGNAFYIFFTTTIAFILFMYIFSFIFKDPMTSFNLLMMIIMITISVEALVKILTKNKYQDIISYIFAIFPYINFIDGFSNLAVLPKISFVDCWKLCKPNMIFSLVDIVFYGLILFAIEKLRIIIAKRNSSSQYLSILKTFQLPERKSSPAVQEMENEVRSGGEFDISAIDVTRLFVDEKKQPVVAVNQLTLGIKHGEVFGFLGANGAGKTTMISMISGGLSVSSGEIKLCGEDVQTALKHNMISLCPQTNTHLTPELTPEEQLNLFSVLSNINQNEAKQIISNLIDELKITTTHVINNSSCSKKKQTTRPTLTRELSGGNQRKLSLAVAFLRSAPIILLDEPTASLDPNARIHVHNLIREQRGKKTILLCTHLIEEAEELCDNISIMLHGQLHAIGTPQNLSTEYGTDWNVDIETTEAPNSNDMTKEFIEQSFPSATKTRECGSNITYSVPKGDGNLIDMFDILNRGVEENHGIKYFSCSSSSLEKAFIELILKSNEEVANQKAAAVDHQKE